MGDVLRPAESLIMSKHTKTTAKRGLDTSNADTAQLETIVHYT